MIEPKDGLPAAASSEEQASAPVISIVDGREIHSHARSHGNLFGNERIEPGDWRNKLSFDGNDQIVPNLSNVLLILENDPNWTDVLGYDEYRQCVSCHFGKCPPVPFAAGDMWRDVHDSETVAWLQRSTDYRLVRIGKPTVREAIETISERKENRFNSFVEEKEAIVWGGTEFGETFLPTYLGTEDTPWTRLIGPKFLMSIVARAYKPGCKVDTVLVLEGAQGIKKSWGLRALVGDDRFIDDVRGLDVRDLATVIQGKSIAEMMEFKVYTKKSQDDLKTMVRKREDICVKKWQVRATKMLRTCVFTATINASESYLFDETGNRTVWPVRVVREIDESLLERDRDQIFAEAILNYKCGQVLIQEGMRPKDLPTDFRWWLEGEENDIAKVEQADRYETDPWNAAVLELMKGTNSLSMAEVLDELWEDSPRFKADLAKGESADRRIARIFAHHGWTVKRLVPERTPENPNPVRELKYWRPFPWPDPAEQARFISPGKLKKSVRRKSRSELDAAAAKLGRTLLPAVKKLLPKE